MRQPADLVRSARAVVFDAVGTVLIPHPGAVSVYASAARRRGLERDPDAIVRGFKDAYAIEEAVDRASGWATSDAREEARWRAIVAAALPGVPDGCFDELYRHFADPDAWRVPDEVGPLLVELSRRGLTLGLGSNYDWRLGPVVAGRPELAPLAGRVVVSSRVGFRKPDGRFFAAALDAVGCAAADVVFVGDDVENDFAGATAFGLSAVLVDPGGRHPGVEPRVASLAELAGG